MREFELHFSSIGGAIVLAAIGMESKIIQREKRWSSDALMAYIRANIKGSQLG